MLPIATEIILSACALCTDKTVSECMEIVTENGLYCTVKTMRKHIRDYCDTYPNECNNTIEKHAYRNLPVTRLQLNLPMTHKNTMPKLLPPIYSSVLDKTQEIEKLRSLVEAAKLRLQQQYDEIEENATELAKQDDLLAQYRALTHEVASFIGLLYIELNLGDVVERIKGLDGANKLIAGIELSQIGINLYQNISNKKEEFGQLAPVFDKIIAALSTIQQLDDQAKDLAKNLKLLPPFTDAPQT